MSRPVLYEIDPATGEADGTVHWFCCAACRDRAIVETRGTYHLGLDSHADPATICEACLKPLSSVRGLEAVYDEEEGELSCPFCEAYGLDAFRYMEDVQNVRQLIDLDDGTLAVESHYDVCDEGGDNPRFLCTTCDQEVAIPTSLDIEWR